MYTRHRYVNQIDTYVKHIYSTIRLGNQLIRFHPDYHGYKYSYACLILFLFIQEWDGVWGRSPHDSTAYAVREPNSYFSTNNGLILFSTMDFQRLLICVNIRSNASFSTRKIIAPKRQPNRACAVVTIIALVS